LEIKVSPVKQVNLTLPKVDPLILEQLEWWIVNKDNAEDIFKELEKKGYDEVIFGVTDKGYEILSVNNAKILSLVQQQRAIIYAYEQYHNKQKQEINKHNNEQKQAETERKKNEQPTGMARFVRTFGFGDLKAKSRGVQ
jgi:uncharacterized protein YjcR